MTTGHVLLLGPPGAGKGTQSSRVADSFDIVHITTGDALRARKDMETEFGTPREYMETGELVPDPVVNEIVKAAIDAADGFILDGYPRNREQAAYLDEITELDVVISLEVTRDELLLRLTGRRICEDCGTNFHVEFTPPETEDTCDDCGGGLVQREDDSEETVEERLNVFEETTRPVIEHYRSHKSFHEIDGERSPAEVFESITTVLESALPGS